MTIVQRIRVQLGYTAVPLLVFLSSNIALLIERHFLDFDLLLFEQIIYTNLFVAVLFLVIRKFLVVRLRQSIQIVIHGIVIGLLLSCFVIPNTLLNVDRSRSFYVLSWIDSGNISYSENKFKITANSPEAADEAGVIQRVLEQRSRGLIQKSQMKLTSRGELTLEVAKCLSWLFKLENWALNRY